MLTEIIEALSKKANVPASTKRLESALTSFLNANPDLPAGMSLLLRNKPDLVLTLLSDDDGLERLFLELQTRVYAVIAVSPAIRASPAECNMSFVHDIYTQFTMIASFDHIQINHVCLAAVAELCAPLPYVPLQAQTADPGRGTSIMIALHFVPGCCDCFFCCHLRLKTQFTFQLVIDGLISLAQGNALPAMDFDEAVQTVPPQYRTR